jgi:hypothetical protein
MISRPTGIGVRDGTAVTQGVERPEQGTVVEDAAAAAWHGQGIGPERAVAAL